MGIGLRLCECGYVVLALCFNLEVVDSPAFVSIFAQKWNKRGSISHPKTAAIRAIQIGLVTVENRIPSRAKLKPTLYLAA